MGESAATAEREIRVYRDRDELATASAAAIAATLRDALARRGTATLALSGGGTPLDTFRCLVREELPWERVDLFWVDERCVPPDDPESNYGNARRELLEPAGVPETSVHRMRGELPPAEGARGYERLLRSRWGTDGRGDRAPAFDLALMGIGEDGHTASLFPGQRVPDDLWVVPSRGPVPPHDRVTLTYAALRGARRTVFLVRGEGKAGVLARILDEPDSGLPAARVAAEARSLVWMLERSVTSSSRRS